MCVSLTQVGWAAARLQRPPAAIGSISSHSKCLNTSTLLTGTSEMHLVSALDSIGGMRAVLGLHETVCTGAAGTTIACTAVSCACHFVPHFSGLWPFQMVTVACQVSQQWPCCTWAQVWPMDWPTCTTHAGQEPQYLSSSVSQAGGGMGRQYMLVACVFGKNGKHGKR